ncbi:MAG TPA: hypothetical protein VG916_08085 [Gemmatimonadaceae bacterium]|nr:hypothetical protein [Gemmatimonadaceae bacterium]
MPAKGTHGRATGATGATGATSAAARTRLAAMIGRYPRAIGKEGRAALARLRRHAPGAAELVYDNYAGLVVGFCSTDRPSDAVFSLIFRPEWLTLCFLQGGPKLPDPAGILRGGGTQVRHVRLTKASDLDRPELRALLEIAASRARTPFVPTGRRSLTIRVVAPRRRERRPAGPRAGR